MRPLQGKSTFIMVKISRPRKFLRRMTRSTISPQRLLVIIFVAGQTILRQTEKRILNGADLTVVYKIRLVTRPAVRRFVSTCELVPRQVVVKSLLIKPDHFKFPSMVFAVAGKTILALHFDRSVVAQILIYPRLKDIMTLQTLCVGYFFPQVMTKRTISGSLVCSMRIGQLTR